MEDWLYYGKIGAVYRAQFWKYKYQGTGYTYIKIKQILSS